MGLPDPVDGKRKAIVLLADVARGVGREFEDGRTADTPVSDEQRARGTQFCAGNRGCCTLCHQTHERAKGGTGDVEREERGDGRNNGMAQVSQVLQALRPWRTARCDGYSMKNTPLPICER